MGFVKTLSLKLMLTLVSLLPVFREQGTTNLYLGPGERVEDFWHLSRWNTT